MTATQKKKKSKKKKKNKKMPKKLVSVDDLATTIEGIDINSEEKGIKVNFSCFNMSLGN